MNLFKRFWNWLTKPKVDSNKEYYSISFDPSVKLKDLPDQAQEICFYKMKIRPAGIFEIISKSAPNKAGISTIHFREITTDKEGKMDEDIFFFNFRRVPAENIDFKSIFLSKTK